MMKGIGAAQNGVISGFTETMVGKCLQSSYWRLAAGATISTGGILALAGFCPPMGLSLMVAGGVVLLASAIYSAVVAEKGKKSTRFIVNLLLGVQGGLIGLPIGIIAMTCPLLLWLPIGVFAAMVPLVDKLYTQQDNKKVVYCSS